MAEDNRAGNDNPYKVPEAALSSSDVYAPEGKMYTQAMIEHLKNTKPWVRFLAVLGFIGIGVIVIAAISVSIYGFSTSSATSYALAGAGIAYLVFGGVYLIPTIFLNRYASSINELLLTGETKAMENALRWQKSFWKFMGICMIVCFGFMLVAVFGAALVGIYSFMRR